MGLLIQTYWAEIVLALMAFVKVIVNLTPTEADNKVFGWLDTLINAIVSDRRKARRND
jgi:hypothetical protein|tara:strand:- start:356 stop:529 length:174 start_codon:yes stop_codon:yes gene_type:complete